MEFLNVRPLPNKLQIKAQQQLNEVPKNVKDDIRYIRDWLSKQQHLPVNPDDQLILTFLRGCKFNYETTKQKLDVFFTTKSVVPKYLSNRNPMSSEIQHVLKTGRFWVPLPKFSDPLAPRLFYHFGEPFEPFEKFDVVSLVKTVLMVMDILLHEDDEFIVNGYCVVQYINGFSANHLTEVTPSVIKNLFTCFIKRYPVRVKKFYFIDVPSSVYTLYNVMKPVVPKKLQSRVSFHKTNDFKAIHDLFPRAELPFELGGNGYSARTILDEWRAKIERHGNWLMEDEKFRSDESKRNGKINYDVDVFGLDGSFKKIELD